MAEQGLDRREIQFQAVVTAEPWSCGGSYLMGKPASEAKPSHLRFFVHDVALQRSDGEVVPLLLEENQWQGNFPDVGHNVGLLDFDDATGNCRYSGPETRIASPVTS